MTYVVAVLCATQVITFLMLINLARGLVILKHGFEHALKALTLLAMAVATLEGSKDKSK